MGISGYREWKRKQIFQEMLKETGVEERIKALEEKLANQEQAKPLSDEEITKLKLNQSKPIPQDFINMFTGEEEQFYPNGKPQADN